MTSTVDESLYSRQLYVFGHEAQQRMATSRVLIVGMGGVGVEVAKNVVLAGVQSVTVMDDTESRAEDAGSNWCIEERSVKERVSRAAASLPFLQQLNPNVHVNLAAQQRPINLIVQSPSSFTVVVVTSASLLTLEDQVALNSACRERRISFISAAASGLFGRVFVDVGSEFTVVDPTGEVPSRGLISHVSQSSPRGIVTCHEEGRHGLSDGDVVTFEEVEGMTQLNGSAPRPVRVLTPFAFSIEDTSSYSPYSGNGGYYQQVQQGRVFSTQGLAEQLHHPTILQHFTIESHLHALFLALEQYRKESGGHALPAPLPRPAVERVMSLLTEVGARVQPALDPLSPSLSSLLARLARISSCELNPMCALLGGVVGQEVLKAVTGKFTPLQQWLYVDASHALPEETQGAQQVSAAIASTTSTSTSSSSSFASARLLHQTLVFGAELTARLSSLHYFLVGAGAIGCEMLKNLALMGVGRVTVTDMDGIEKSNLNRQFLFRNSDVGQLKATVAAREAMKINPSCSVTSHALRVGPSTEDVYDDHFWQSLDGVITALDNVDARLYCDQRCVYYQRAMFDSGTLGSKGSVQVVIPHLTESYGASRDPPEESIPICTLTNFPNKIEHTIQWARDQFEGHFHSTPITVNHFLTDGDAFLTDLDTRPHELLTTLTSLHSALLVERPQSFVDCVRWGRVLFEVQYNHKIRQLLHVFPADSKTAEGVPFWSATKRQPQPLTFSLHDSTHLAFVRFAARLRANNYNLTWPSREEEELKAIHDAVQSTQLPTLEVAEVKIATTDSEAKAMEEKAVMAASSDGVANSDQARQLTAALRSFRSSSSSFRPLQALEFDKDGAGNGHVEWITAASNLRARNYRIKEETTHKTKQIAGKIIPAIATTTALVTGLVCLELYKWAGRVTALTSYRNSTLNLALPFLASAEPLPAATSTAAFPSGEWKWSQWDRIEINEGRDLTLDELMSVLMKRFGVETSMVSYGAAMLYYSFGNKKKMKERKSETISRLVEQVTGKAVRDKEQFLILEACVSPPGGDDIDIPFIRYQFR